MLNEIRQKIRKSKMEKRVGKVTLENIKQAVYEELYKKIVTKNLTLEEYEDEEIWSDRWQEFLDATGLELMYEVSSIAENGRVVDIKIEILEI